MSRMRRGDWSAMALGEKAALEFARKMTVASSTVSDDEFHALVKHFDRKSVAAMVILMGR